MSEYIIDLVFEKCVMCGKNTDVKKNMPIESRSFYIEGCGQLCEDCAFILTQNQN